jgi:hypothetical protein
MASVVVYLPVNVASTQPLVELAKPEVATSPISEYLRARACQCAQMCVRMRARGSARACTLAALTYVSLAEADRPVTATARLIAIAAGRAPEPVCASVCTQSGCAALRCAALRCVLRCVRAPTFLELQNLRGLEPAASRKAICKTVRTAYTPACQAPLPAAPRWRARCRPACRMERRAPGQHERSVAAPRSAPRAPHARSCGRPRCATAPDGPLVECERHAQQLVARAGDAEDRNAEVRHCRFRR